MVKRTKPDIQMDDWHDDDDSSVESDFQEEEDGRGGVVITIDDMSVEFTPVRPKSKYHHAGSFVSVLSTESSLEIDTVPASPDDMGTQNATWDDDNNQSPPTRNQNGRFIALSSTANQEGTTTLRKERKSGKKGLLQASDSSLNESCSSIKDLLCFGSIHEHAAFGSVGSSDEEESDDDEDDDDSFEHPANIKGMHILQTKMNKTNVKVEDHEDDDSSDDGEQEDSLVDHSVVNMILRARTTDMKDQTLRAGKQSSKYSMRNRITPKVNGVTGDSLLNRFLDSRHHVEKESPACNQRATPSFLPGRLELTVNTNDLKFDSVMRKTDSLNHVNKKGQRVVKTMHENHNASRRTSLMHASHQDALLERFLSSEARRRQIHTGSSSLPTSSRGGGDISDTYNSMNRVDANKARRLVGTRLGGN